MLTWAIAWMNVKCKDSEVAEGMILIDVLAFPSAVLGDVLILEIIFKT